MKERDMVLEKNFMIIIELLLFLTQEVFIWLQCYKHMLQNEATSLPCTRLNYRQ